MFEKELIKVSINVSYIKMKGFQFQPITESQKQVFQAIFEMCLCPSGSVNKMIV